MPGEFRCFRSTSAILVGFLALIPGKLVSASPSGSQAPVAARRSLSIGKRGGNIDQLIELPDGRFLVRDSGAGSLGRQSVELYSREGRLLRAIGSIGQSPGSYYALKSIAFDPQTGSVWIADMVGRISQFTLSVC